MTKDTVVTGLETSTNFVDDEKNLVEALLGMASYKENENCTTIAIKRNGKICLEFKVHALGASDISKARKRATRYVPNPAGSHLPKIAAEVNSTRYDNYLIYEATSDEDKKRIWGNKAFMDAKDLVNPEDSVDVILEAGEKQAVVDRILLISGYGTQVSTTNDDEEFTEYVKN